MSEVPNSGHTGCWHAGRLRDSRGDRCHRRCRTRGRNWAGRRFAPPPRVRTPCSVCGRTHGSPGRNSVRKCTWDLRASVKHPSPGCTRRRCTRRRHRCRWARESPCRYADRRRRWCRRRSRRPEQARESRPASDHKSPGCRDCRRRPRSARRARNGLCRRTEARRCRLSLLHTACPWALDPSRSGHRRSRPRRRGCRRRSLPRSCTLATALEGPARASTATFARRSRNRSGQWRSAAEGHPKSSSGAPRTAGYLPDR
jgi:hypothetical protein